MKSDVEVIDPLNRTLTVELDWSMVSEELESAYKSLAKEVRISGFRKGKIPRAVLKQRYGRRVENETLERLIQDSYEAALIQNKIRPVARPELEHGQIEQGKPFVYKARVEVQPDIELKKLEGFELKKADTTVSDEMMDTELNRLREGRSVLVPIEDRDEAKNEDTAIIDYEASRDDVPLEGGSRQDHALELGAGQSIPGFEDQVLGMKVGEKKSFELTMPSEGVDGDLAGQAINFQVELKALKTKELPELDDEFAVDLGQEGVTKLDELKAKVNAQIQQRLEEEADRELRKNLVDQLIEANPFPVPSAMVSRQQDAMVSEIENLMQYQGVDASKMAAGRESLRKDMEERAEREVRSAMLLSTVAEQKKIEVDDEDLDEKFEQMAARSGQQLGRLKAMYSDPDRMNELRFEISQKKVLDHLVELSTMGGAAKQAEVKEPEATENETPSGDDA